MNKDKKFLYAAVTSAYQALYGQVPPFLRAATINIQSYQFDKNLKRFNFDLFFYCNGEITEDKSDFFSEWIECDFFDSVFGWTSDIFGREINCMTHVQVIRLDEPKQIPTDTGYLVYKRHEEGKFDKSLYPNPGDFSKEMRILFTRSLLSLVTMAAQQALLNRITSNLEYVNSYWDDKTISLYFYYSGNISILNEELTHAAANEFKLSFPELTFSFEIIPIECIATHSTQQRNVMFSRWDIRNRLNRISIKYN